jgi:hypothetical protein
MISITARNGTHRFQQCASSRHGSVALLLLGLTGQTASKYRHNREPNLAKKWIGQKKAIRQSQVFRKFYDDAIASRSIIHPTIVDNQRGDARSYIASCSVEFCHTMSLHRDCQWRS